MSEVNIGQEFKLKNVDETRNSVIEEMNWNELMCKKEKKVCATLIYIEHFLILALTITRCISVSPFTSLVDILIEITSSTIEIKICAVTAGVKKYKSIIKKIWQHSIASKI